MPLSSVTAVGRREYRRTASGRGDLGAATMEYVGILLLVAGVITALVVAFVALPLGPAVREAVCTILSLGCAPESTPAAPDPDQTPDEEPYDDEAFLPPPCLLTEVGEVARSQIKVAFFTFGEDYGFIERTYADARVTLTAVNGATIGLIKSGSTQVVDLGRLEDETQLGGKLEVSAGLDMDYGDTWSFASQEEADGMRDQLDDYLMQQQQMQSSRGGGAGLHLWWWLSDGYVDPPKDPQVTFATIGLDAAASGSFGLHEPLGPGADGAPTYLNPSIGFEAMLSGDYDVKTETNHDTGEQSYTYTLVGTGSAAGNLVVGEAGVRGSTTGAFRVTRNEAGELTGISMISTREGGVTAALEGRSPVSVPVGPSGSAGTREQQATVTEVKLDIQTAEQRQVVQDWLSSNNEQFGVPLVLTANGLVPSETNPGDPFEDLLFRDASVSQVTYDNVTDTKKFGLDVKAGWELGLSVALDNWRKDAVKASYLGAPRPAGTRPILEDGSCL